MAFNNCSTGHRSRGSQRIRRPGKLYQRALLFGIVAVLVVLGIVAWRMSTGFSELEVPSGSVEPIVNGTFLGLTVEDRTSDQFLSNPWLRVALHEAYRSAYAVRRHQMSAVLLHDGQHPETGEAAVLIIVTPRHQETPQPPFQPVAIRRWRPKRQIVETAEQLAVLKRMQPPSAEDLNQLRDVWSGGRYANGQEMFRNFRTILMIMASGIVLIIAAGAYRSVQGIIAQAADPMADQRRDRTAVAKLREVRITRESNV